MRGIASYASSKTNMKARKDDDDDDPDLKKLRAGLSGLS